MKNPNLRKYWLVDRFAQAELAQQAWHQLLQHYGNPERYYHNLDHLMALFVQLERHQAQIESPELVNFSIFYHDIIYNVKRKDNERASAALAGEVLATTTFSPAERKTIQDMILATEKHIPPAHASTDLLFFLDFDLSILGAERSIYRVYTQKIRHEYAFYSDEVYYPGRRRVLESLLAKKNLFQTEIFREQYESKARANLLAELERLKELEKGRL